MISPDRANKRTSNRSTMLELPLLKKGDRSLSARLFVRCWIHHAGPIVDHPPDPPSGADVAQDSKLIFASGRCRRLVPTCSASLAIPLTPMLPIFLEAFALGVPAVKRCHQVAQAGRRNAHILENTEQGSELKECPQTNAPRDCVSAHAPPPSTRSPPAPVNPPASPPPPPPYHKQAR